MMCTKGGGGYRLLNFHGLLAILHIFGAVCGESDAQS